MENTSSLTYKIPALDIFHYYLEGEKAASVIYYEVILKENILLDLLKEALKEALHDLPHFRLSPVILNNEIRFKRNEEEPVIFTKTVKVHLASKEVHHFLFAVFAQEKTLSIHFHHSLADGRGCLNFLKNVLFHYYTLKGEKIEPEGLILFKEEKGMEQAYAENHTAEGNKPFGKYIIAPDLDMFHYPEPPFSDESIGQLYQLKCPMKPILEYSKRSDATPVPFLIVLLYNALLASYQTEDKLITCGSAVDYRAIFKDVAINNASGGAMIPCLPKMKNFDLPTQMTIIRARLDLELQKANLIAGMEDIMNRMKAFQAIPLPVEKIPGIIMTKLKERKPQLDFYVSYVGGVRFPAKLQEHIENLTVSYPSFLLPTYMMGIENNGILNLTFTQSFANPAFIQNFYKLLKQEIPEAELIDRGKREYDCLVLSEVEKG